MVSNNKESTPLLPNNNTYYFKNSERNGGGGSYESVSDGDAGQVVETLPPGSNEEDFAPRALGTLAKKEKKISESPGFFSKLFGSKKKDNALAVVKRSSSTARMVKPRAAPIKIEPKVFFANERTFLAWMHISVILAGASVAILALSDYDDIGKQLYGLIMLPVAIAFLVYSMFQYVKRSYMIRNKLPGPYDDTVGPTVLGIMLMASITAQFAIKLIAITK